MSEIANALKKIKHNDGKIKFSYHATKKISSLSANKFLFIILLLSILLIFIYFYLKTDILKKQNKDIVNIENITTAYKTKIVNYEIMKKNSYTQSFYSALIKKDFDTALSILNKMDKNNPLTKKMEGILLFVQNDYAKAKLILEDYLKNEKDITVKNLLSYIYYNYGDYVKALNLLQQEDIQDGNILINKAMVYEKLGNTHEALHYYEKSLPMINNDLLKYKIKIKISMIKLSMNIK